jgi:hypothetical protein
MIKNFLGLPYAGLTAGHSDHLETRVTGPAWKIAPLAIDRAVPGRDGPTTHWAFAPPQRGPITGLHEPNALTAAAVDDEPLLNQSFLRRSGPCCQK